MSSTEHAPEAPVDTAAIDAAAADSSPKKRAKKTVVVPTKVAKQIDSLQKKIAKETERRKKAEDELKRVKSLRSRVHRIPKAPAATDPPTA